MDLTLIFAVAVRSFLARLDEVEEELLYYPGFGVGFDIKVFKISWFLNPVIDLNYIWYDDRYWSKTLFSAIPTPGHDLQVKVTDLEILY